MASVPRPDAEAAWIAWLAAGGFPSSTQLPRVHVEGMTRVSRFGGKRLNLVQDKVQILVETWAADPFAASQKAHALAARCEAADPGTPLDPTTRVSEVTTTGPVEFPDPSSALTRYQFVVDCTLRRIAV